MLNKGLPPQIATSNGLEYHQQDREAKQYISTKTELQFEIECPRCYDTMILIAYTIFAKNVTFAFIYKTNKGFLKLIMLV